MHHSAFLRDLALVMTTAGLAAVLFHRLRQPALLAYLLAGYLIGPHGPGLLRPLRVADELAIHTLAELGLVFLMFSIGLEFSLKRLRALALRTLLAGAAEIALMLWLGHQLGQLLGWGPMDSLFLGAMISISSTTIAARTLAWLGRRRDAASDQIFGILIVEDVIAVGLIAVLSGVAVGGAPDLGSVGKTLGGLAIFVAALIVFGLLIVPRLLSWVSALGSREILLLFVVALCLGIALVAERLEYSMALGAFLVGALVAESRELGRVVALTEPIRDMFSALFFAATGMLIDPAAMARHLPTILVMALAVVVGKTVFCGLGSFATGRDARTSLRVGLGLSQIGEFSFVIAALGVALGATNPDTYAIAVGISALTAFLSPHLIRNSDRLADRMLARLPQRAANAMELYTRWIGELERPAPHSAASGLFRRLVLRLALNAVLSAGLYLGAVLTARVGWRWMDSLPVGPDHVRSLLWLAATLASLPLFADSLGRLRALAELISGLCVKRTEAGAFTEGLRRLVAGAVLVAGTALQLAYLLLVSAPLLPSTEELALFGVLALGFALFTWRSLLGAYENAELALAATLAEAPDEAASALEEPRGPLPNRPDLGRIELEAGDPACGRRIRELELRERAGAEIVGLERGAQCLASPDPDTELAPGDRLLVLGTPGRIAAARAALQALAPSSS